MFIRKKSLDDLLRAVILKLLRMPPSIRPTRGPASERAGVLLELTNPLARLSRTERKGHVFSCLGEFLWYLAKSRALDFIQYYVQRYGNETDDGATVHGAYGPRLFRFRGINQVDNVIALLREKRDTRRAVVQLFDAEDLEAPHKDVPCTCSLQFLVRQGRLHLLASMRSNDAYFGLPHDVFTFTMLQEVVATTLGVKLGSYKHVVGSLHLYEDQREAAQKFLDEGFQETILMPAMPQQDPWGAIGVLLDAEASIRLTGQIPAQVAALPQYWQDLARLLYVYHLFKTEQQEAIPSVRAIMASRVYEPYIEQKEEGVPAPGGSTPFQQLRLIL